MEPTFRLVMFGGLALLRDGIPVSGALSQRKRLALLGLLAASPNGLARDSAIAMLWPESDEERARNSLAQVVHALRREIGDAVVRTINGSIALDPESLTCDVVDFRAAIGKADYTRAVELYRGRFLEGVYLRDAPEFEGWCEEQRLELGRLYMASIQELAERATQRGDRSAAVEWWRRCAGADPLSGRVARCYMQALAADGKREDAIRHAEVYTELVRAELGAEPDAGVVAFASELRNTAAPAPNAVTEGPLSVARLDEAAPVRSLETRARAGLRDVLAGRWMRYAAAGALAWTTFIMVRMLRTPVPLDRRVVVAAFENRTGEPALDQLGFMAADWIAEGLQRTNLADVVDPATAMLASRYVRSERTPLGDAREVRVMASETRARLVVTGSYYRDGDTLVMAARISNAPDEKLLDAPIPVRVTMSTPVAAVDPIRERVLGALAMRLDHRLDRLVPPGSSSPPTFAAYRDYMEGLAAFQRGDRRAAIGFFSRASAADSTFALPLVWEVWALGASAPAADTILQRLASMREQLAPLDRLALDYQEASARRDLRAKLAAAQEASRLAPGSHWSHNLGMTLTDMGRFSEAVAAYEQIDRGKGWTRGWDAFWDRFTVALHLSGDHDRELQIAREARRALPSKPLPVYLEARALAAMDRVDELNQAINDLEAYRENADSLGRWLSLLAREVETSGDTVSARHLHDRAVSWFASLPTAELAVPARQLQLGIALYRAGRYEEARPIFEKLIHDPSRNRRDPNFDPHAYLGGIYAHLGDRARADSVIDVLLRDERPGAAMIALHSSARIAAAMGERDRAVGYLRRQIALSGRGMSLHYDNRDLDGLTDYPPYRALFEGSEQPPAPSLSMRERRTR